jgi:hypothetical protein
MARKAGGVPIREPRSRDFGGHLVSFRKVMYLIAVFPGFFDARPSRLFSASSALLALCVPAWSQLLEPGAADMAGIRVISAPRPAGLGGAYTALAEGADAIGINPAGLARETGRHYTGSVRPDMVSVGSVAYTLPGAGGRLAFSASYVDFGEIPGTDETGAANGTLRPFSLYPAVSYARAHGERWRWGATFKMAQETLGDFQGSHFAWGAAGDAGVQYQPAARNIGFGASVTNVGSKFRGHFEGDDNSGFLPAAARAGIFYHPRGKRQLALAADLEAPLHGVPGLALGAEYRVIQEWQLRAGTRWDYNDFRNAYGWINPSSGIEERYGQATKLAAGTTVRIGPVDVDYAAQWWRELGFVHSLGVSWAVQ